MSNNIQCISKLRVLSKPFILHTVSRLL